ncbi:gastric triacylglycerol lipase-like [Nasonia vitripennis]|uniref:Lipase n=1 Tax=Nasonia vitripennis TaxID=7425 RepID=A0A7M7QKY6_NASVI|nr:gastric triacylglycerol lipase-like [Nasonia vitripennis]
MIKTISGLFFLLFTLTEISAQFAILKDLVLQFTYTNITQVQSQQQFKVLSDGSAVLDFIGLVQQYDGYTAEEYDVQTEDGYILKLHRISGSPLSPKRAGKPVIYLQHCLAGSTDVYVALGRKHSLAFLLADAGYDVWLGNVRGNTYSKRHVKYTADRDSEFWNFSMDEMAVIDVPKFIDVVLEKTGQKKLTYIGFSMGTTLSYILLSEKPEYNDKMKLVVSMAPIAYFIHPLKLPAYAILVATEAILALSSETQINQLYPQSNILHMLSKKICSGILGRILCKNMIKTIASPERLNLTALPDLLAHTPAGSSLNTWVHYYQIVTTGEFKKFDFGASSNEAKYGSAKPPNYDLSKITSPQAMFYSEIDIFSSIKAATRLKKKLKNVVAFEAAPKGYNHMDFVWANDAYEEVYLAILKIIASNP